MGYREMYEKWLTDPVFDEETKEELRAIEGNETEIEDRFYQELEFGTAGLRGIMGAGTNRMNRYTVGKATQGLANYICRKNGQERGVAIAYDSRHNSREFSGIAALIFAANGIKVYIFEDLRPTPELSYTIRKLGCISGVNLTASHNPPEYNGYKAYWEDGAQITPPYDVEIMEEVQKITDYGQIKTISKEEAVVQGLYVTIGEDVDKAYLSELKKCVLYPEDIEKSAGQLKIVYTPLHGAGNIPVRRLLGELGFTNVYVVPEQEKPNGDFPTVSYPNPEDPAAFSLALDLAREKNADLVLATDPDSDRIGLYVKDEKHGGFVRFNGNMIGCFLEDYVLGGILQREGKLPENGFVVRSIVTSKMVDAIAASYGVSVKECLTGFKWIGRVMKDEADTGKGTYLFGFEESFGYLVGTEVRDKDAVVSAMTLCGAAAHFHSQGKSMLEAMEEMYEKYGYFRDKVISITHKGLEGSMKIKKMMADLREHTPETVGDVKVMAVADYNKGVGDIPKSNVLQFVLEDGSYFFIRPSGTEPKIKMYLGVKADTAAKADKALEVLENSVRKLVE